MLPADQPRSAARVFYRLYGDVFRALPGRRGGSRMQPIAARILLTGATGGSARRSPACFPGRGELLSPGANRPLAAPPRSGQGTGVRRPQRGRGRRRHGAAHRSASTC
jgi:hypothetical protein